LSSDELDQQKQFIERFTNKSSYKEAYEAARMELERKLKEFKKDEAARMELEREQKEFKDEKEFQSQHAL
jgi:hypothetical protein